MTDIHFNKKSPKFNSMPKDRRFNPVFTFLVEHPDKGYTLLDTGLHSSFAENRYGNFGRFLGTIVKSKADKGQDVISQLKSITLSPADIRTIILSHLHVDHPSSLCSFKGQPNLTVYVDKDELKSCRSLKSMFFGYKSSHIKGFNFEFFKYPQSIPPFDKVWDFFGDGSLFILGTAGHSAGHVSVLLNMIGGPFLLTFDAAHRKPNFVEDIPPIGNYDRALKTIHNLKALTEEFPRIKTIFGHDPDQLGDLVLFPKYYS